MNSPNSTDRVKRLVVDSDFLVKHKRYEAALALLLIAVDASARKMFPKGTSSIDSPAVKPGAFNEMRNGERFKRFLGTRLRRLMNNNDVLGIEDGRHDSLPVFLNERKNDPEVVLYDVYRNDLIHEGKLPVDVVFDASVAGDSYSLTMGGQSLKFSSGLLSLLRAAVVNAPINGKEFGISHVRLLPANQQQDLHDLCAAVAPQVQTSPGRVKSLLSILQHIGPTAAGANAAQLKDLYAAARYKDGMHGPSVLRRNTRGPALVDHQDALTDAGVFAIQTLLKQCEFRDLAE